MNAILQKIKADIFSRPLISSLILVTIIASSTLLTLALATLMNLNAPYDKTFTDLNGAHLWLHFKRDRIRLRDIRRIEALPGVVESTGLRYSIRSRVRLGDTRVWVSLRALPTEMPAVNRLLIHEGRYLSSRRMEMIANEELNYYYHLAVGDEVGLTRIDGKEIELPVIGLAYNPMWDTYRNSQPSYLYLSQEALHELYPDESTWDWSIGLRLADPESVDETVALIEPMLRPNALESHTDWRDVKTSAIFEGQLNFIFLGAFSFFAILATILVVASSISSIILSQFRQIGILKAIGFTQNQILWLYLGQYLVLSVIGSLLGLLFGILLSPLPLESVAISLNTTFQPPLEPPLIAMVLTIIPGVVIFATLSAAYRGAQANIIKAIAVGVEAPKKKPFWGVKMASRLNLPVTFVLGLDDIFAKPLRSFLTGLNLTLGVIGIVFGLTLNATLEAYGADPSLFGIVYDALVTRDETSDSRTQHLLHRAPGVEAFYSEYLAEAKTQNGQSFQVRAVEGDVSKFPIQISKGRFFQPNTYEAIAGQGLLDWLNLEVGDELTLILEDETGRPITWQIVGQYAETSNAGQMLMVDLPTAARFARNIEPDTYYLKLSPDYEAEPLKQFLEPRSDTDLDLNFVKQNAPDSFIYLQIGLFVLAAILIGIALINVFNTSILAMQEKLKVIGTLKTIGMTPAQIGAMINTTAIFLGFIAVTVGIPLGLIFIGIILETLSGVYGLGQVNMTANFLHLLLLIPLTIGVSMIGSFIPSRHAARLSIVRVLQDR